jgi:hypothetical protein
MGYQDLGSRGYFRLFLSRNLPLHQPQQLRRFHPEAAGKVKQGVQGGALLAAFQLSDVIPMVAGLVGKRILGIPFFLPESPKHHTEGSLGAGGPSAPGC